MHQLHPQFIENMRALLGDGLGDFMRALDSGYAAALRINPLRRGAPEAAREFIAEPVPWADHGYYIRSGARPGAGLAHFAGAFYIQEASAMLPAAALAVLPGERVLDLCAAPGGKSSQLAFALSGQGILAANEPDPKRARMLAGNLERLGVTNAVVVNEYPPRLAEKWPGFFDAILVDAPCSGEGMFRREPEARLQWNPAAPAGCARRQADILDAAARMLRPGGRLLYSTCTYNRLENEDTVAAFLETHPDFSAGNFQVDGLPPSRDGMLKLYPHQVRGDGQFACLMIKRPDAPSPSPSSPRRAAERRRERGADPAQEALSAFRAQFGDIIPEDARPIIWGEYLAACPAGAPPLDGIKTVSPGLMLAKLIGRRLEPAHQLAMACASLPGIELTDADALAYVRGETVPCEASGYLVARWRGLPLGWGKASGGVLKNHLPKGLRRTITYQE